MNTLRITRAMLLIATVAALFTGCATKKKVKAAKPARIGSSETGIASWYGDPYHGRRAANGEIYDMERMTAAHRTLPFNTWVRVKNLDNGKTVDVRIQDRGPFVNKRIIDLSRAAAREIEMIGPGTAKVKLTVIAQSSVVAPSMLNEPVSPRPTVAKAPSVTPPFIVAPRTEVPSPATSSPPVTSAPPVIATPPSPVEAELFAVQIGAFQDRAKAEALRATMKEKYGIARIIVREGKVPFYRVLVGEEESTEKAGELAERMRAEKTDGFVVRIDTVRPQE
jgi:rare lipoprotein A